MNGTAKPYITLLLTIWLGGEGLHAFSLFGPSTPPSLEDTITALKDKQANDPNNPIINYNLGVACFRNKQVDEAKTNFSRALEYAGDDKELRIRCLFNCGNSSYKTTLDILPPNWEQKDQKVEQDTLAKAITEIKEAITHYEKFQKIDPTNKRADKKLESAKETLKKLEEKWQQQQKQDQKDDQKKQNKQQDQNNKNQQKNSSSDKKQEQNGQQKADKDQRQGDRPNTPQDPSSKPEQRQNDNKEQKQDANNGQQPDNHQKSPDQKKPESSDNQGKDQQQEKQQSAQQEQQQPTAGNQGGQEEKAESQEMRTIRGMLDNLQDDEAKTQADLMKAKMKKIAPQQQSSQKPW